MNVRASAPTCPPSGSKAGDKCLRGGWETSLPEYNRRMIVVLATLAALGEVLAEPFLVKADGKPVSVERGHADPVLYDWDGDGVRDLVVGQFAEGRIWVYRNTGTEKEKSFAAPEALEADGAPIKIDAG